MVHENSRYKRFNPLPYRCIECGDEIKSAGELEEHLEFQHDYTQPEIDEHLKHSAKLIQQQYKKYKNKFTIYTGEI